jgi:hypothetical protein
LIAIGAILKYAVTASIAGIDLQTAGLILMLVGVAGLVIGLFLWNSNRTGEERATRSPSGPPPRSAE